MRTTRNGTVTALVAAVGATVMAFAGAAWACTPHAYVGSIDPEAGPAGSRVTMTANDFNPGPVEIRWNGTNGPQLATANGPSFAVSFTIPSVDPGSYTVLAVQRSGDTILGKAPVAFEVTPSAPSHTGGYSSSSEGDGGSGGQDASGSTESSDGSATSGTDQASSGGSGSDASSSTANSNGGTAFPSEPSTAASSGEAASSSTATGARHPSTGGSTSRQEAGSGTQSSAGAEEAAGPASLASEEASPSTDIASPRSLAADLWSGFRSGDSTRRAALTDAPAQAPVSAAAVAGGVFSLALLAMFVGFVVAEAGRRRVTATTNNE